MACADKVVIEVTLKDLMYSEEFMEMVIEAVREATAAGKIIITRGSAQDQRFTSSVEPPKDG